MYIPSRLKVRRFRQAARLRANLALSRGQPEAACENLLAVFTLGRHLAMSSSLPGVMLQTDIESDVVEFVATNFYRFTPEALATLEQGIQSAPPRVDVSRGMETERIGTLDWFIHKVQEIQLSARGRAKSFGRDTGGIPLGPGVGRESTGGNHSSVGSN
jgi:hypothetical protein